MKFMTVKTLNNMKAEHVIIAVYMLVLILSAVKPFDRSGWFAEVLPALFPLIIFMWISKRFRFSTTSYVLVVIFPVLQTIGAHYSFEKVPFEYITDLFNFERNHYDRVAHMSVGLYAYPLAEYFVRRSHINGILLSAFLLFLSFLPPQTCLK